MGTGGIIPGLCGVGVAPVFPCAGGLSFISLFSSPSLAGVSPESPFTGVFVLVEVSPSFFASPFSFFS